MAENQYTNTFQTYPRYAEEFTIEGSFKRYTNFPTPKEVYDYSLIGMPKYFILTKEPITVDHVTPFLESAVSEIEHKLNVNLSEVTHNESFDWIDGLFVNNLAGLILTNWPATSVTRFQLKYPHTMTTTPYQTFQVPPNWIYLQKNKINIVASDGSFQVFTDNSGLSTGGLFSYLSGFNRGPWGPGSIEVTYTAGFQQDKLPLMLNDLIKTWAARRFLNDILPVMFPYNSVSSAIDGVSQSVSLAVQTLIAKRIESLDLKIKELAGSFLGYYGRTLKKSYIGA